MMNLIQRASRRIDQLQRGSGVDAFTARLLAASRGAVPTPLTEPLRPGRQVELDVGAIERRGWIGANYTRSRLAEQLRQIKRPLLRNARDPASPVAYPSLIMVTSVDGGAGKTFTAVNLAMSIALEIGTRALLVDADVIRPGVADGLGFEPAEGLLDLLQEDPPALADLRLASNIPRLSILPAGTRSAMSSELFASASMAALLRELGRAGGSDIVIFDAPPLLPTNEAKQLAGLVGQIVLVVEAGRTTRAAVAQALDELRPYPLVLPLLYRSNDAAAEGGVYDASR